MPKFKKNFGITYVLHSFRSKLSTIFMQTSVALDFDLDLFLADGTLVYNNFYALYAVQIKSQIIMIFELKLNLNSSETLRCFNACSVA